MMGRVKYQIIEGVIQLFPPSASLARSSHFFTLSELAILETQFRNIWQMTRLKIAAMISSFSQHLDLSM